MRLLGNIALIVLALLCAASMVRAAEPEKMRIIWYSSHRCPEPADKTALGATPEHPIEEKDAGDPFSAPIDDELELSRKAADEGKERATSRFECKWVRLGGFFTPTNYYHYRGTLVRNAWTHYGKSFETPRYTVERFHDPKVLRSMIGHRQVTLVGRFYYLCLTAPRGEDILFLFGPCHYGGVNGMMLDDVRIEKIHDDDPRYLLGESNRSIIGDTTPFDGEERDAVIAGVRSWAKLVQRGPEAYAREAVDRNPVWEKESRRERAEAHARVVGPDSYVSYLNGLAAFRSLDTATAPVAAFWDSSRYQVKGCICLQASCADQWPLTEWDADYFYGQAACTTLDKRDGVWVWY